MEVEGDWNRVVGKFCSFVKPVESNGVEGDVYVLNSEKLQGTHIRHTRYGGVRDKDDSKHSFDQAVDRMAMLSAEAQGLSKPLSCISMLSTTPCRLYVLSLRNNRLGGLIKIGEKRIFVFNELSQKLEGYESTCILDIYIHESIQRDGWGKILFDSVLESEKITNPGKLAYDRPSPKLLSFLRKHYGLSSPLHQNNNYVIYKPFLLSGK